MSSANGGTIHIASSVDENFLPFVGPVATSMGYFARADRPIDYRVFYDGPQTPTSQALDGFRAGPVTVRLVPAPEQFRIYQGRSKMGVPTLVRLAADQALPDLDRVVFIDVDVLVRSDIGELFDIDMGHAPYAASVDTSMYAWLHRQRTQGRHSSEIDVDKHLRDTICLERENWYTYLNTGVAVMNLQRLRDEQFGARAVALLDERVDSLLWPDQDTLTLLLKDRTAPMPPEWNVLMDIIQLNRTDDLPDEIRPLVERQRADPRIVHFAGPRKPWEKSTLLPYGGVWWHFVRRSPVADVIVTKARDRWRRRRKLADPRVPLATWIATVRYGR
jgi:lipopolysaccharide biosynthesis glycosyltransferase